MTNIFNENAGGTLGSLPNEERYKASLAQDGVHPLVEQGRRHMQKLVHPERRYAPRGSKKRALNNPAWGPTGRESWSM